MQIDFNPARIDYEALLMLFWQSHNPGASRPTQYKSVIFYHDETQRRLAEASLEREAKRRQVTIHTQILPFQSFYRAEDYHQKYYLRREKDLIAQLQKFYPDSRDMADATTAARINGYLGGFGTAARLTSLMGQLGLSPEGGRRLREIHAWRKR